MKAHSAFSVPGRQRLRAGALGLVLLLTCGCAKEDEELQRQLVETRAALAAKTRELEQVESRPAAAPLPPSAPAPSPELTGELANARARIADLESQLAAAKRQTPVAPAPAPAPQKLDLDALKDKLESDLTNKAKTLREVLMKQAGVARIDEIGIRGIEYPPEIIAPFRSAITFALSASDGRQLRLVFPVTADLDGYWSLPGPDKIQQAYKQVKDAPSMETGNPASAPGENSRPQEVATKSGGGPGPAPQGPASGFRQVDPNTYQFDWGDSAKSRPGPAAAPNPTSAAPPNSPTVSAPQPSRPAAPRAPAQPEMTIPKPVMPVQRDIIIKF